jgi:DNA-binding HxlR family transcriptional regulator
LLADNFGYTHFRRRWSVGLGLSRAGAPDI